MIFFSIGLPSRFAEWCDAVTARLVESRWGPVEICSIQMLDELAVAAIRTKAAHLLARCRQPVLRLQAEIVAAGRPFLVALGDPQAALRDLLLQQVAEFAGATRAVASSCAAMLTVTQAPGALVLSSDRAADPVAAAEAIARHFEVGLCRDEIARLVADLAAAGVAPGQDEDRSWWDGLAEREQTVAAGALQSYVSQFGGGAAGVIVWEPELFYSTEAPTGQPPAAVSGPIDLTGRARFLVYGPYINLPPGAWSANVVVGFSSEAAEMSFVVEVVAGSQLAYTRVQPTGEQVVEAALQFTIGNSVDRPVEIRIVNERAAFDGRLVFGYVTLTPRVGVREETEDALRRALRE